MVPLGVDPARYREILYEPTQAIGDAAYFLGFDSIIAPNARWSCNNLILFTVPPRGLRQKIAGRADPFRHAHGVVARHPAATRTTTKTTLTGKDATSPLKLTLNGA